MDSGLVKPTLMVVTTGAAALPATTTATERKDRPRPIQELSEAEKPVWRHLVAALGDHGLIHRTDTITLHVIVKTYVRWAAAEAHLQSMLEKDGTYFVKSPNGYEQPHQMYYVARDLKKDLLRWLPEAALTIAAWQKATREQGDDGRQRDLFPNDPLSTHVASKPQLVWSNEKR